MAFVFTGALAVKELEPGEWHWLILRESQAPVVSAQRDVESDELRYTPQTFSDPHANAAAAWAAGYLVVRASMRRAARSYGAS